MRVAIAKEKRHTTLCISHATADGLARLMHETVSTYCKNEKSK